MEQLTCPPCTGTPEPTITHCPSAGWGQAWAEWVGPAASDLGLGDKRDGVCWLTVKPSSGQAGSGPAIPAPASSLSVRQEGRSIVRRQGFPGVKA